MENNDTTAILNGSFRFKRLPDGSVDKSKVICVLCQVEFQYHRSTSSLKYHLRAKHADASGGSAKAVALTRDHWTSHSSVVRLNVGGHLFSTSLSTLRKHPDSKLAEMFSGPPKLCTDPDGHYFIDRDGSNFRAILDFLRTDQLPTQNIQEVYREAVHYNIKPLIKCLEETPQLFGELVGRQQFLSRVPHYKENIEVLIRIARAEAVAARHSTIMICVLQTEEDWGSYNNAINSLEAKMESVVTFGPWKATPGVKDLLDCIQMDIENHGYRVTIEPHVMEKSFLSRSYDYFYKLNFTWW